MGKTLSRRCYMMRETIVSAIVNGVISTGIFLIIFGGIDPIPVWGIGSYAFDLVLQSFVVGLMASLVPGLLARKAAATAGFGALPVIVPDVQYVFLKSLKNAVVAIIFVGGLCAFSLWFGQVNAIGNSDALIVKTAQGTILGAEVTYVMLHQIFSLSAEQGQTNTDR